MTKPDTGGRGEGRSSDLVMVEREVLERAHGHLCKIAGTEAWTHNNLDGWQVTPGALREYAESAAKELDRALQSVEGGVQGSIATKQATNESSASVLSEALDDVSSVYDEMCIQFSGVHADDRMDSLMLRLHSALKAFGREQVGTICAHEDGCPPFGGPCPSCEPRYQYSALAQLTKTPSADHDAGNLRSLAEPNNHQPHALSQGWRDDMENAPVGVRFLIAGRYPNGIWYVEESYRHYAGHFNGRKLDPPTHWMPLPAPPVPETNTRDSSESTTGGTAPDHTTIEERGR